MKPQKTIYVFDGVVFDQAERILIDQRVGDALESVNGLWEVPGGKLEFGETPEQAIGREILEEIGCRVKVKKLIPYTDVGTLEYPDKIQHTVVFYYICELMEDEGIEVHDHKIGGFRWVKPEELDDYEFMFGNRVAIDVALKLKDVAPEDGECGVWEG
jgi:8-oxo-dGTP diphosphatase